MGSLLKAAVAVSIVVSCPHSVGAATDDKSSLQPDVTYEIVLQTGSKHPSSRKYVAGPWPRFAKEMLA